MNNQDLRTILINIQDHLSDNDRKRLGFFFSKDNALRPLESLIDPDKISEEQMTYLMKIFDENQCVEAVKLLKGNLFYSIYLSQI